jgi:sugar-specific transcriptional regulator TrmB
MTDIQYHLLKIGLTENEARIIECLITIGVASASDIHRETHVPRNKIYETIERLANSGFVEIQPGRPVLFKLNNIEKILSLNIEERRKSVERVVQFYKSQIQENTEKDDTLAWIVRGRAAIRIQLSNLASSASTSIFMFGGYPNSYIEYMASMAKNITKNGTVVRLISMLKPTEEPPDFRNRIKLIEYRTIKLSAIKSGKLDEYDAKIINGFEQTSTQGCAVVIDESLAFNIVDSSEDPAKARALLFNSPGVPIIEKGTIERIIAVATRRC